MKNRHIKSFCLAILGQIVLYGIQYIALPAFLWISPYDTARNLVFIVLSTILLSLVWMLLVSICLSGWLVGIIPYTLAVCIYHPDSAYGIGVGMVDFSVITVIIYSLLILLSEFVMWFTIKLVWKFRKK